MRRWIQKQLAYLTELEAQPEFAPNQFDDVREIVREAGSRAAAAGLPAAVRACSIRAGGLAPSAAREVLAACLAAMPQKTAADRPLTIKEAAEVSGIPESTLYKLVEGGKLAHSRIGKGRGRIRIKPADLQEAGQPQPKGLRFL